MQVTIIDEIKEKKKLSFPLIAKNNEGKVVFFTSEYAGLVLVDDPDDDELIGEYSEKRPSCTSSFWRVIPCITIKFDCI